MTKQKFEKRVLVYETIGFLILSSILWLNEIIDLPNKLFGALPTPINITEVIIETFCLIILFILIIFLSHNLISKIKYLEGFVHICSYCKRVRVENKWITIEEYIAQKSDTKFSHGVCPECLKEYNAAYNEMIKEKK